MGTVTTNLKLNKPPWTQAASEVTAFNTGMDNLETRHSYDVWYGDANYATLALIAAATNTVIHIPPGSDVTVDADTEFSSTAKVVIHPNAKFTLTGEPTTLYIPNCECLGDGPHFDVAAGCWVIFGSNFKAPRDNVFTGAGYANVRFNLGPELAPSRQFSASTGWTLGANWQISGGTLNTTAAASTECYFGSTYAHWESQCYRTMAKVTRSAGTLYIRIAGMYNQTITSTGTYENFGYGSNTNHANVYGTSFEGSVDYVSYRLIVGGIAEIYPEWWGAVSDGATDCTDAINTAIAIAGANHYDPVLFYTAMMGIPSIVKFGSGNYYITGSLIYYRWAKIHGTEGSTCIQIDNDFTSDKVFYHSSTGGKVFAIGTRPRFDIIKDIMFDADQYSTSSALYLMYIDYDFGAVTLKRVSFKGKTSTYYTCAMYVSGTTSTNDLVLDECTVYQCNFRGDGTISADKAASILFDHYADHQQMKVIKCHFNNDTCSLYMSGSNNTVMDCDFEAYPVILDRVKRRGAVIAAITAGTRGADSVFTITSNSVFATNAAATGWILITGLTGDWAALNGMQQIKSSTSTSITIETDSSGYSADSTDSASGEYVGGTYFRAKTYGNGQMWMRNYFDGGGNSCNLLGCLNSAYNQTSLVLMSDENNGATERQTHGEFLSTGTPQTYYSLSATRSDANTLTIGTGGDHTAKFPAGGFLWVHQSDIGYIRCEIDTSSYGAPTTTVNLVDNVLVSGKTITVYAESLGWAAGTNFYHKYRGVIYAKPADSLPA